MTWPRCLRTVLVRALSVDRDSLTVGSESLDRGISGACIQTAVYHDYEIDMFV
jgi:hypothetical protein